MNATKYRHMPAKPALLSVLALLPLLWTQNLPAQEVGRIQYTRGAVTMQNMDGSAARLVARNETLREGEVLKTGPKSFTILKLQDGTRMTVRPNSSFSVAQMNAKQDASASALLRLFRGGLRTITGYISKKNPKGYRIQTPVATIGIRGTEFDMRLCDDDCAEENSRIQQTHEKQLQATVARAVFVRGQVLARNAAGENRELVANDALFEGDTVYTSANAYVILVFRDRGRISLQANTVFRIDEHRYVKDKPEQGSSLFSLLRGGLRTVTGLIGKLRHDRYKMRTSVATIGIRGTGYDLECTGACAIPLGDQTPPPPQPGEGLYAYVWDSSISMAEMPLQTGQAGYMENAAASPVLLPEVPARFLNNPVPRPDRIEVDESKLFSSLQADDAPPGLYVSVSEGIVDVTSKVGNQVVLRKGESGYSDVLGRRVSKLKSTPAFQRFDVVPKPDAKKPASVNLNAVLGNDSEGTVCVIR